MGRINSVLELTLTPSLPPSPRPGTQAKLLSLTAGDGEGERLHYGHPFWDQSGRKWHNKSKSKTQRASERERERVSERVEEGGRERRGSKSRQSEAGGDACGCRGQRGNRENVTLRHRDRTGVFWGGGGAQTETCRRQPAC